jgi:predicted O-methyltransferase YrrM
MADVAVAEDLDDAFIRQAFQACLGRVPSAAELAYGRGQLGSARDPRDYFLEVATCTEAQARRTVLSEAPMFVPPGHYYSPVVNVSDLRRTGFLAQSRQRPQLDLGIDSGAWLPFFQRISSHFTKIEFPLTRKDEFRYFFENDFYTFGDAQVLSAIIMEFRPRQIIEVGSGFSSAVMLDTLDAVGLKETTCTFVEPYPERLRSLLRPTDAGRVRILEAPVQAVDLKIFESLNEGDLLFLDTTHLSKTGSDVNHELFEILPRLKPGVLIHFHDVFHNFEYPDAWVLKDNRSWNELYILRAFLMNSAAYEVIFFNDSFARLQPQEASSISPVFMRNPGGGLWLKKRDTKNG